MTIVTSRRAETGRRTLRSHHVPIERRPQERSASPARLIELTAEKAAAAGRRTEKVPARGTSQQCSACGDDGERKTLQVRRWVCQVCGTEHDRDVNAAKMIKQRFTRDSGACSSGVRGEEVAGEASERPSVNREEAPASRREQRATSLIDTELRQASLDLWDLP